MVPKRNNVGQSSDVLTLITSNRLVLFLVQNGLAVSLPNKPASPLVCVDCSIVLQYNIVALSIQAHIEERRAWVLFLMPVVLL